MLIAEVVIAEAAVEAAITAGSFLRSNNFFPQARGGPPESSGHLFDFEVSLHNMCYRKCRTWFSLKDLHPIR